MDTSSWQYDEMIQLGRDFADRTVVEAYDAYHRQFRDIDKENEETTKGLGLERGHVVADFGCGTGNFVLRAAEKCSKVFAIDISPAMLDYVKWKAESNGLTNIICRHGGFLTYVHDGEPLDAISTSLALHHLPDFWKQKALQRLNGMLKKGGRLFLADVIFSEDNFEKNISAWINAMKDKMGAEIVENIHGHLRKEHSTFDWIMEGLLARAGFEIDEKTCIDRVLVRYFCTKTGQSEV